IDQPHTIAILEGWPERQQFVERHTKPIAIASRVGQATESLWRHIAKSPNDFTRLRQLLINLGLGKTEIGYPDSPPIIEQEVRRLDITMQYALIVRVRKGLGDLKRHAPQLAKV